jgi:6-pyruvoyltetrahydropterin/6-carboxytetrahydropterin synthase
MQSAVQVPGYLGHRQPVQVAQRERGPVVGAEPVENLPGTDPVDDHLPWVVDVRRLAVQQTQPALLPLDPSPVVGKLVPGNSDQPWDRRVRRARLADRVHSGQERLGRDVLGQAGFAAAGQQVAVYVRQRLVVQPQQPERGIGPHLRVRHTFIVVRAAHTPTGSAEFSQDQRLLHPIWTGIPGELRERPSVLAVAPVRARTLGHDDRVVTVQIGRRESFNAAHRLYDPGLSEDENRRVFGKCANLHGHNYVLEVVVGGEIDQASGYVMDLKDLSDVICRRVIRDVDHRNLNTDVSWLAGRIPTAENLALTFWERLRPELPEGRLRVLRVWETDKNWAEVGDRL